MINYNAPVYCLHCGKLQDWEKSQWGVGPQILKALFICECGWWVEASAKTKESVIANLGGKDED